MDLGITDTTSLPNLPIHGCLWGATIGKRARDYPARPTRSINGEENTDSCDTDSNHTSYNLGSRNHGLGTKAD